MDKFLVLGLLNLLEIQGEICRQDGLLYKLHHVAVLFRAETSKNIVPLLEITCLFCY